MPRDLDCRQMARLKAVLIKELQDVDVSECWETEKARIDSNNDLLDAFITAKKIEGCSDKTLAYYRNTIERFLCQASRLFPSSEWKIYNCERTEFTIAIFKRKLTNIQYCDVPFWTVDTTYYTVVDFSLANPYYLYRFLSLLDLSRLDSGTGVPSMTFDSYYNIRVQLPDLAVQQRVAAIMQSLDEIIKLNDHINQNLHVRPVHSLQ